MTGIDAEGALVSPEPARRLVGHRGWPARFPENSLSGVTAALATGCRWVEFDVQVSADGTPFVVHDEDLRRTAAREGRIYDMHAAELDQVRIGGREGGDGEPLPRLEAMLTCCAEGGAEGVFVEVKRHSIQHLGIAAVMDPVMDAIHGSSVHAVPISFLPEAVEAARERGAEEVGWALRDWSAAYRRIADVLAPRFLFVRGDRIPSDDPPWPGPWDWVAYDVEDPAWGLELMRRGVQLIETDDIGRMREALAGETLRG